MSNRMVVIFNLLFIGLLTACGNKTTGDDNITSEESIKLQQYLIQGERLYLKHCSNCHQIDGSGFAKIYPPLNTSDFIDNNLNQTICISKNGMQGEIIVNGVSYNQPMPAIENLTPLEIAEIVTYLYNSWGRNKGLISVNEVKKVLDQCQEDDKNTDL